MYVERSNTGRARVGGIDDTDIRCPAGRVANCGMAARCTIEHHTIKGDAEPTALLSYCLGDWQRCPTWRTHKEAEWADRAKQMEAVLAGEARDAGE